MKFAGTIVADFPGDDLISKVIDLNDKAGITINPPFSLKNNRYNGCLDFRGGASNGKSLVINPRCHGNDSQVLEYDKSTKQIKVHSTKYCLDVKDGYNLHHQPVIAYQCHNRKNQQWNMNSDKTISSLMTGTRRCLDVDQHVLDSHGNPTLSMHSCSQVHRTKSSTKSTSKFIWHYRPILGPVKTFLGGVYGYIISIPSLSLVID